MWEWDQLGLWSGLGRKKPTLCPPPEPPSMSLSSSRIYVPCHMQAGENCSHWFIWGKLLPIPKQTWVPFSQKDAWRFWGPVKSKAQSLNTPTGLFAARTGGSWVPKHPKLCNVRPASLCSPWSVQVPGAHRVLAGTAGPLGRAARHQHHVGGGQGRHSCSGEEGCQPAGFPWQLLMPLRIRWTKLLLFSYYCRFVCSQMQSQAQDTVIHCLMLWKTWTNFKCLLLKRNFYFKKPSISLMIISQDILGYTVS